MRTTLDIDDDVLRAVEELAELRKTTAGKMISELARKSLPAAAGGELRNGVPLLPIRKGERPVTLDLINRLRDEERW